MILLSMLHSFKFNS